MKQSWLEIYANLQFPKTPKSISDKVPYRSVTRVAATENLTRMKQILVDGDCTDDDSVRENDNVGTNSKVICDNGSDESFSKHDTDG
ncbi:hypothetical protein TNCV_426251 [Trichonephila clavipes]|nr:hypothetical protein TNCV_426251 [Trichonephila clavipes]